MATRRSHPSGSIQSSLEEQGLRGLWFPSSAESGSLTSAVLRRNCVPAPDSRCQDSDIDAVSPARWGPWSTWQHCYTFLPEHFSWLASQWISCESDGGIAGWILGSAWPQVLSGTGQMASPWTAPEERWSERTIFETPHRKSKPADPWSPGSCWGWSSHTTMWNWKKKIVSWVIRDPTGMMMNWYSSLWPRLYTNKFYKTGFGT